MYVWRNGVSSVVPLLFERLIFVDAITSLDEISWNHGITRVLGKTSKKKTAYFMTSGKKVGGPRTKTKFQKKI